MTEGTDIATPETVTEPGAESSNEETSTKVEEKKKIKQNVDIRAFQPKPGKRLE